MHKCTCNLYCSNKPEVDKTKIFTSANTKVCRDPPTESDSPPLLLRCKKLPAEFPKKKNFPLQCRKSLAPAAINA